jgi:phosphohistidine phosphatase
MPLLYLVRHGIAEDDSVTGRDEDRALTQEGTNKVQRAAAGFAWLEVEPDAIWASPLRRARQTAEILRVAIAPELELRIQPQLRPETDVDDMRQELKAVAGARSVVLVGHEPSISALASALLTGSESGARLPFKPGSALALELNSIGSGHSASLRWFLTAEQLGRLSQ